MGQTVPSFLCLTPRRLTLSVFNFLFFSGPSASRVPSFVLDGLWIYLEYTIRKSFRLKICLPAVYSDCLEEGLCSKQPQIKSCPFNLLHISLSVVPAFSSGWLCPGPRRHNSPSLCVAHTTVCSGHPLLLCLKLHWLPSF